MAPSLLVFDLDGTLVDTAPDLLATLDAVLPRRGFRAMHDPSLRDAIGLGARHMIKVALARQGITLEDAQVDPIFADFLVHYEANICRHSRLFPGVDGMLDRFADAGWSFAVCTNKREHLSRLLLEKLGVAERFSAICGSDTFTASKPDPIHLRGTIEAALGDHDRSVMVGDSRTDRDAARRAEIAFVGVSFGYTPVPMAKLGPDLLIDHYDALTLEAAATLLKSPRASGGDRPADAANP